MKNRKMKEKNMKTEKKRKVESKFHSIDTTTTGTMKCDIGKKEQSKEQELVQEEERIDQSARKGQDWASPLTTSQKMDISFKLENEKRKNETKTKQDKDRIQQYNR